MLCASSDDDDDDDDDDSDSDGRDAVGGVGSIGGIAVTLDWRLQWSFNTQSIEVPP
jgi:hypothetical protein